MREYRAVLLFISWIGAISSAYPSTAHAAADDSVSAVDAMVARLARLQNIQVKFDLNVKGNLASGTPTHLRRPDGRIITFQPREANYHGEFDFLNGNARIDLDPTAAMLESAKKSGEDVLHLIRIYTPDRVENLTIHSNDPRPVGSIRDSADFPPDSFIDIAIGVRLFDSPSWLTADEIRRCRILASNAQSADLEMTDAEGYFHRWSLDLEHGGAPTVYEVANPSNREFVRYEFSNFDDSAGVRLQKKLVMTRKTLLNGPQGPDSRAEVCEIDTAVVNQYTVGDPANKLENYLMTWPKETAVLDDRTGITFRPVSTQRTLSDQEIYQKLLNDATQPATGAQPASK